MKKAWKNLTPRRRVILFAALAALLVLILYGWAGSLRGIWYEGRFLYRQEPGVWQGEVYGEQLTITKKDGTLLLTTPSGQREFRMEGKLGYGETMTLWEDGVPVFTGSYEGGHLLTDDGLFDQERYVTVQSVSHGKTVTEIKENGKIRLRTALDMDRNIAVRMMIDVNEQPRGSIAVPLLAGFIMLVGFAELWWPMIWFHRNIGRFVQGEAVPSEEYQNLRVVGIVSMFLFAGMILALGYTVG